MRLPDALLARLDEARWRLRIDKTAMTEGALNMYLDHHGIPPGGSTLGVAVPPSQLDPAPAEEP